MEASWSEQQRTFMQAAVAEAEHALHRREVPVGCVIVCDGEVIGRGSNRTNETRNGTRHAEFEAIDDVLSRAGNIWDKTCFGRCELYVTVEPCIMCASALALIGIGQVYYGCCNDKFGGCGSILPIHQSGCGTCDGRGAAKAEGQEPAACSSAASGKGLQGRGFPSKGGLFAERAVQLLQDFYIAGNPNAPRPHRPLRGLG